MTLRRKFNGAKICTEAWDWYVSISGRGASYKGRSHSESGGGRYTSENAGMSSENYVRIIMAENLRFLGEGSTEPKYLIPCFQEKHLEREVVPVPQTDTGR